MSENEEIILMEEQDEEMVEVKPTKNKLFARKIEPEWIPQIMEWVAQGDSQIKICKKIFANWNVNITQAGIALVIKRVKLERSNLSKAAVRENVGTYIVNDLEIIKLKKEELVQLSTQFKDAKDWKNYFQSIDKIKDFSKMLFELSGVNENQVINEAENAKQDLMELFEKFDVLGNK